MPKTGCHGRTSSMRQPLPDTPANRCFPVRTAGTPKVARATLRRPTVFPITVARCISTPITKTNWRFVSALSVRAAPPHLRARRPKTLRHGRLRRGFGCLTCWAYRLWIACRLRRASSIGCRLPAVSCAPMRCCRWSATFGCRSTCSSRSRLSSMRAAASVAMSARMAIREQAPQVLRA